MIRKILVYTYGDQSHDHSIKAAAQFASQNDAELVGLFVKPDFANYSSVYGSFPLDLANTFYNMQNEFAEKSKGRFNSITQKVGCRSQWHVVDQYEKAPSPTAYADYIFVGQPSQDGSVIFSDMEFVDHAITATGLPIIIIPKNWSAEQFAQRPLLAWKETREAIRAVRFSLPIMREVDNVNVVTATQQTNLDEELINGIEICEYLTEHGVQAKFFCERLNENENRESESVLRHAKENSRDLIIAGGYSHSRFRELVLGGMTRELIKGSPIPVMLAH
jgi:nucleotide-binding universal stress UspA family protein